MVKAILFDLDGTLLPMDQDVFIKAYFSGLAKKLAPYGYDPRELTGGIWAGTAAMVSNDGSRTNEDAFWAAFRKLFGEDVRKDEPVFDDFYRNEFQDVRRVCGFHPAAAELIGTLKSRGVRLILATNPLFPHIATMSRIGWAGLNPGDFELITTYENARYCKPNLDYYREILKISGLGAEECIMVGNDAGEDMIASRLNMRVFLLTDCLINSGGLDISSYPQGGFKELADYLQAEID